MTHVKQSVADTHFTHGELQAIFIKKKNIYQGKMSLINKIHRYNQHILYLNDIFYKVINKLNSNYIIKLITLASCYT